MYLSKSDYITFLKHPAWLWLKKHSPNILPKPDDNSQAIINSGKQFEKYAEQIFNDSIKISTRSLGSLSEAAKATESTLKSNNKVILQAVFINHEYLCIADVIRPTENGYELIEIKAVTTPDKEHYCDLAFQKAVIENCGIPISKCFVLHAHKDYIRHGDIKLDELVAFTDVTDKVNAEILSTTEKMKEALSVVQQEIMPSDSVRHARLGAAGDWRSIFNLLHPEIPKYSIYDLASNKGAGTDKLIAQLEDNNIQLIIDIPENTKLQSHQKDQVAVTKLGEPIIDKEKVKAFIDGLEFPLYFLDYETISQIMPPFDNTWPYQQVVFQHSIHIMQEDGTLTHEEYLHDKNTNPIPEVIKSLENIIGKTGSIIVWNQSFEKSRHTDMAKLYPAKAAFLEDLNDRVVDLMIPFDKRYYQDMCFKGSASIKKVLPVLCSELTYKTLGIQEGQTASRSWKEAIVDGTRPDKDQILANLKEYCGLDTYAMVAIYRKLACSDVTLEHTKDLSRDTLCHFKTLAAQVSLPEEAVILDNVINSWEALINNDKFLLKLISIKNYESLLEYSQFLNGQSNLNQLIDRLAQKTAELDITQHMTISQGIERLVEQPGITKTPDFVCGNTYFEVKYISKLVLDRIENRLIDGLNQILQYTKSNNIADFNAEVWLFSYDRSIEATSIQSLLENIILREYKKYPIYLSFHCVIFNSGACDANSINAERGFYNSASQ